MFDGEDHFLCTCYDGLYKKCRWPRPKLRNTTKAHCVLIRVPFHLNTNQTHGDGADTKPDFVVVPVHYRPSTVDATSCGAHVAQSASFVRCRSARFASYSRTSVSTLAPRVRLVRYLAKTS